MSPGAVGRVANAPARKAGDGGFDSRTALVEVSVMPGYDPGRDKLAVAGENESVATTEDRCQECGGRMQDITAYGGVVVARMCRGCGKRTEVSGAGK